VKTFDMDFGLFYTKGGFYGGLSASHLLSPTLALSEKQSTQLRRHYFAVSGYKFEAFSPSLEVVPSILVKSDGSSFQFSINTNVIYNKKFWGGVTYRAGDSVIAMLGLELVNGLKLGYAYDVTTSEMGKVSNGTHELMLNYCFELSVPQFTHKYKSARFL
jgi:type IX secretion system PorP/SprF family membrane protein